MIVFGYMSAILVGLVLGLLGGGGSILTVPILVYIFDIAASLATSYSLFLVGTTSLVGFVSYLRARRIDLQVGSFFLVPSMAGVGLSRQWLLPMIPSTLFPMSDFSLTKDRLILLVFAAVMGLASYSMIRPGKKKRNESLELKVTRSQLLRISVSGLAAGALMGFLGAGGGFLIIPVLVSLGGIEMKTAIGTSLFIITISSLFGFASDLLAGVRIDWWFLFFFSVLSILGVLLGARMSRRIPAPKLKSAFGFLVLAVASAMLIKELLP